MKKPELLAPCGDYNCFINAVNAGADAVYLSAPKFGARAYAKNFSEEELISAINYAHLFGVKVYLTVNTLLKDEELNELYNLLLPYYNEGLDGVIVQDLGVVDYICTHFPDLPVHSSTQMAITSADGVEILKEHGIKRVVLAREVSLNEINKIYENTGLELECFVHGALCYSYSGKCLFSSIIGGRSGNRGRCAGPCRQPYNNDSFILSTKDICCLKLIPDLCNGSIASFKIEGRMKSPEYVALVTGVYRKHIDRFFDLLEKYDFEKAKKDFLCDKSLEKDYNLLITLYTRGGNSEGYYFKHNGKDMLSLIDASYKSENDLLHDEIYSHYFNEKKIPVYGYVYINKGDKALITLSVEDCSVSVEGNVVLESVNKPLNDEVVIKQINKLGNTAYCFKELDVDISDGSFLRVSDLNELRRTAFAELTKSLLRKYKRNNAISDDNFDLDEEKDSICNPYCLNVSVNTMEQLEVSINSEEVAGIYVPFSIISNIEKNGDRYKTIEELKSSFVVNNKEMYVSFPSVIRYDFFEDNIDIINKIIESADGVLSDNFEVLNYLRKHGYQKKIIGDIHIYILNKRAKEKLKSFGFSKFSVPIELNKKELLKGDFGGDELIIYGHIPMMVSAQCVNSTLNGCDKTYKENYIVDRTNAKFLCVNDCSSCINTIYNGIPYSLHGESDFIRKINPSSVRIMFINESKDDVKSLIRLYSEDGIKNGIAPCKNFTRGHVNRGVL